MGWKISEHPLNRPKHQFRRGSQAWSKDGNIPTVNQMGQTVSLQKTAPDLRSGFTGIHEFEARPLHSLFLSTFSYFNRVWILQEFNLIAILMKQDRKN